jgi:hypothetical protein
MIRQIMLEGAPCPDSRDLVRRKTKVLFGRHHTNSVGVALASTPTLHTNHSLAPVDDAELDTVGDTPLQTTVNVLLPDLDVEVGLLLGEQERIHSPVEVGILIPISRRYDMMLENNLPVTQPRCE